jgi:hypothetical protein
MVVAAWAGNAGTRTAQAATAGTIHHMTVRRRSADIADHRPSTAWCT